MLLRIATATNPQTDVLLGIFDKGRGMGTLQLENGTVEPLIVAIAAGQTLLRVAIDIENPWRNSDRHKS